MLMSAVVAVALGVAPVNESESPQLVRVDEAKLASRIGPYTQSVDKDGKTHVRGFDRLGRAYDLAVDTGGHVEGSVGIWHVAFDVKEAA